MQELKQPRLQPIEAVLSIMAYLLDHRVTGLPHTKQEAVMAADEIYFL
jgi:hypothetical protein